MVTTCTWDTTSYVQLKTKTSFNAVNYNIVLSCRFLRPLFLLSKSLKSAKKKIESQLNNLPQARDYENKSFHNSLPSFIFTIFIYLSTMI